ncbi:hypothetical protein CDAR_94761 [Caerostris darwini]|uniref:Uncharacterized protein n=1 Tax=Caerostris darwini TaxID=1538125 RepID=A0AAV4PI41_9ARAC|nr:hypothetical protein CDAR_94761 [Caerostris darwini]
MFLKAIFLSAESPGGDGSEKTATGSPAQEEPSDPHPKTDLLPPHLGAVLHQRRLMPPLLPNRDFTRTDKASDAKLTNTLRTKVLSFFFPGKKGMPLNEDMSSSVPLFFIPNIDFKNHLV